MWRHRAGKGNLPLRKTAVHVALTHTQRALYFGDNAKHECVWRALNHFGSQYRCCSRTCCSMMYTVHIIADIFSLERLCEKMNSIYLVELWRFLTQMGILFDVIWPWAGATGLIEPFGKSFGFNFCRCPRILVWTIRRDNISFEVLEEAFRPTLCAVVKQSRMAKVQSFKTFDSILVIRTNHHHRFKVGLICARKKN